MPPARSLHPHAHTRGARAPRIAAHRARAAAAQPPPAYPRLRMQPMHISDAWRPPEPPASARTHMFKPARARAMFRWEKSAAGETGSGLRGGFFAGIRRSEVPSHPTPHACARDSVRLHAHGRLRVLARSRNGMFMHYTTTPRAPARPHTARAHARTTRTHRVYTPRVHRKNSGADWTPQRIFSPLCVPQTREMAVYSHFKPAFARARTHKRTTNPHTPPRWTPGARGASVGLPAMWLGMWRAVAGCVGHTAACLRMLGCRGSVHSGMGCCYSQVFLLCY